MAKERHDHPSLPWLVCLAHEAGRIMKFYFERVYKIEKKEDGSVVTTADREINAMVLQAFEEDFPHISVDGEEGSRIIEGAEYWVLFDPLDGTHAFICGLPVSSFCISVLKGDRPIGAVIHEPFAGRSWFAEQGKGASLNEWSIDVSTHSEIAGAKLGVIS